MFSRPNKVSGYPPVVLLSCTRRFDVDSDSCRDCGRRAASEIWRVVHDIMAFVVKTHLTVIHE